MAPNASEEAARAAMAVLGLAATPNDTLSSLSFLNASSDRSNFRSTQFKGGRYLGDDNRLHFEGLVAYQIYNPVLIFPGILPGTELDLRWSSIAATGGLGWDMPLRQDWVLRPTAHLSLGYVTTDAFLDNIPSLPVRSQVANAVEGSLTSGGLGASISLFKEAHFGQWEAEYRFRQSYITFFPINDPLAGDARSYSNQTTFFSRHRHPIPGMNLFGEPAKSVMDAGVVLYHGDGAEVLGTGWLATFGLGLEIDSTATNLPALSAGRIMLNGVLGEGYTGFSIGLGLEF